MLPGDAGALRWDAAMEAHLALLADGTPDVVLEGVQALRAAHDDLLPQPDHPALERFARAVYGPVLARLTLKGRPGDAPEARRLRAALVELLAHLARDAALRRELAAQGERYLGARGAPADPSAADPDLAVTALSVAVEEGGPAVFDLALRRARDSTDAAMRDRLVTALALVEAPGASVSARWRSPATRGSARASA